MGGSLENSIWDPNQPTFLGIMQAIAAIIIQLHINLFLFISSPAHTHSKKTEAHSIAKNTNNKIFAANFITECMFDLKTDFFWDFNLTALNQISR